MHAVAPAERKVIAIGVPSQEERTQEEFLRLLLPSPDFVEEFEPREVEIVNARELGAVVIGLLAVVNVIEIQALGSAKKAGPQFEQ